MSEISNQSIGDNSDLEIINQIKTLKVKMGELYEERGTTDKEILDLSIEIDRLINQCLGL